jgi:hypothetical protein
MPEPKKVVVEFAPGCFDEFDGTQEELDELIEEIKRMAESGEMFEKSQPVEFLEDINEFETKSDKRNLQ